MMLTSKFPSLASSLASSKVLGLYFASSWCPDCTPVTPRLKTIFESQTGNDFSVVYVSSDRSEDQMKETMEKSHGKWGMIPFDSSEKDELKKNFGCCAGSEVFQLGMSPFDRKYGIPTLVLIDCEKQEVISFDGVQDVMSGELLTKYGLS